MGKANYRGKELASCFSRLNIGEAQFDKNIFQGDDKPSDSLQGRKFLDQQAKCQDFKMPCPRSVAISLFRNADITVIYDLLKELLF
jgi:hypothetical protein